MAISALELNSNYLNIFLTPPDNCAELFTWIQPLHEMIYHTSMEFIKNANDPDGAHIKKAHLETYANVFEQLFTHNMEIMAQTDAANVMSYLELINTQFVFNIGKTLSLISHKYNANPNPSEELIRSNNTVNKFVCHYFNLYQEILIQARTVIIFPDNQAIIYCAKNIIDATKNLPAQSPEKQEHLRAKMLVTILQLTNALLMYPERYQTEDLRTATTVMLFKERLFIIAAEIMSTTEFKNTGIYELMGYFLRTRFMPMLQQYKTLESGRQAEQLRKAIITACSHIGRNLTNEHHKELLEEACLRLVEDEPIVIEPVAADFNATQSELEATIDKYMSSDATAAELHTDFNWLCGLVMTIAQNGDNSDNARILALTLHAMGAMQHAIMQNSEIHATCVNMLPMIYDEFNLLAKHMSFGDFTNTLWSLSLTGQSWYTLPPQLTNTICQLLIKYSLVGSQQYDTEKSALLVATLGALQAPNRLFMHTGILRCWIDEVNQNEANVNTQLLELFNQGLQNMSDSADEVTSFRM